MGLIKEFRDFAIRGNVVDMAVGIIIGAAFTSVVNSLVNDVLMPPLGMLTGGLDFSDKKFVLKEAVTAADVAAGAAAKEAPAVALNWGLFINSVISFVIVAFAVFILVKAVNKARAMAEREKKEQVEPAAPPPPELAVLTEIRDLLRAGR